AGRTHRSSVASGPTPNTWPGTYSGWWLEVAVAHLDNGPDPNDPYATRIAETTETIDLKDGRTLAYCEFGDQNGDPVFVFHGGVGSRGFGLLFDDAAIERGVRIVSPDRPGYGRSDPQPNRRLLDWLADVAALADDLGLDRFAVLGVSGGGPYAAACAHDLSSRLTAVAMVSSLGPPDAPRTRGIVVIAWLARWLPWIAGLPIKRTLERARTDPDAAVEARARGKAEPEAAMHRGDAGRRLTAQTAEAGRQGHHHAVVEIAIRGRPWGFDLGDIAVPVGIWHGGLDRTIPVGSAEYLAATIPDARLTVHDDVGHLSLPIHHAEEILGFLQARVDQANVPAR
ncbi:MAG: alpha/beta fold hydrolase, partial [Halobacteriota archaeon]